MGQLDTFIFAETSNLLNELSLSKIRGSLGNWPIKQRCREQAASPVTFRRPFGSNQRMTKCFRESLDAHQTVAMPGRSARLTGS
jgi:hypothetical protein